MAIKHPQTMRSEDVALSAANTARDGSGTLYTAITGAATGTEVTKSMFAATGDTTDGMIRAYVYDGSNNRLIDEFRVTRNSPSATQPTFRYAWVPPGGSLYLPNANYQLRFSIHNAEGFHCTTEGEDY